MLYFYFKNKRNNASIHSDFGYGWNTIYYISHEKLYSDPDNRVKIIYDVYVGHSP